jgi:hypothetical protein
MSLYRCSRFTFDQTFIVVCVGDNSSLSYQLIYYRSPHHWYFHAGKSPSYFSSGFTIDPLFLNKDVSPVWNKRNYNRSTRSCYLYLGDVSTVRYQWICNKSSIPGIFRVGDISSLSYQSIHNRSRLSSVWGHLTSFCFISHTQTTIINKKTRVVTSLKASPYRGHGYLRVMTATQSQRILLRLHANT